MIKTIIWTFLKVILLILVFMTGYIMAHQKLSIPPIDKAIDNVTNYCGDKK